jgi:hypothetical protein
VGREQEELHRFDELVAKKGASAQHRLENQQFLVRTREAELAKSEHRASCGAGGLERTRNMVAVKVG